MVDRARPRLKVPAALAVSVLGFAGSCGPGDDGDSGGDTAASMTASADTGELPDCQATPEANACEATESCVFISSLGGCIIDCDIVPDEATCVAEQGCEWLRDQCTFQPIA
jgi:hypothetical protein